MDIEHTTNLKLPLLVQNQSGKEFIHNEALIILDSLVQNGIIDKDLTTPPNEPKTNDLYIVGVGATDTWENKDNQLTFYDNGWRFIEPREGFIFWVNDEDKLYTYNGTIWQEITTGSPEENSITELQNLTSLGINTIADNDNKLSVNSDYILFNHNGTDSRIKVNKLAIINTASHLFQNNYSGRAEFGLIRSDDFTLKVSNDGNNWKESFVVDKNTGNIDFKGIITNNGNAIGGGGSGDNNGEGGTIIVSGDGGSFSPLQYLSSSTFKSLSTSIKFDDATIVAFEEITKSLNAFEEGKNNGSFIKKNEFEFDWKQPIMSNENENDIVITSSSFNSIYYPYKAMDGLKTGTETSCFIVDKTTGWWKMKIAYPILISEIKFYNNYTTSDNRTKTFKIWKDETKTEALSNVITIANSDFAIATITLTTPVLTNTLYIELLSSYGSYSGIGELEITAKTNDFTKSTEFNNWLDVYAITNEEGTKQDICCYLNNKTFTLPTNFTKKRLIGWLYINNDLNITRFSIQNNNYYFNDYILDAGNLTITNTKTNLRIRTPITNSYLTATINVNYGNLNPNIYITSSDFENRTPNQQLDRKPYGAFTTSTPVGLDGKIKLISNPNTTAVNISTISFNYNL